MRSQGSCVGRRGASSRLFWGMNSSSLRIMRRHSPSSGAMKCPTPLSELCVIGPPSRSLVTSSWVTVRITSGPVTNM